MMAINLRSKYRTTISFTRPMSTDTLLEAGLTRTGLLSVTAVWCTANVLNAKKLCPPPSVEWTSIRPILRLSSCPFVQSATVFFDQTCLCGGTTTGWVRERKSSKNYSKRGLSRWVIRIWLWWRLGLGRRYLRLEDCLKECCVGRLKTLQLWLESTRLTRIRLWLKRTPVEFRFWMKKATSKK